MMTNVMKGCDVVMHFAGLKAVGESSVKPLEYYRVNVGGTINLLKVLLTSYDSYHKGEFSVCNKWAAIKSSSAVQQQFTSLPKPLKIFHLLKVVIISREPFLK